MSHVSN